MINKKAFVYKIKPFTYKKSSFENKSEDNSVHQSSPSWVLTFVRWENRDTYRNTDDDSFSVRDPLVVENDCLQVSVNYNKGTLTPSMSASLVLTDVNYQTLIAPGDFVFVNMLNWESEARDVANKARSKKPINGVSDGFKGIFKIQGVRRIVKIDPATGIKIVLIKINGFAFTEFNNTIYFNPYLLDPNQDTKNQLLFASFIGDDWANLVNSKGFHSVQDIIALLIQSFIGSGIKTQEFLNQKGMVNTPNVHFMVPGLVGSLLGVPTIAAKDVYRYLFGIQRYEAIHGSLSNGMNPRIGSKPWNGFYYTVDKCDGSSILKPEYWNQVKTWSILNQYTNAPLNELYTCLRISPDNKVMPTVVFRQIPFTNEDFVTDLSVTRFMNIPRWNIHPSLVISEDIGRDESARINYVQYFGRSMIGKEGADIAFENAQGNYVYDVNDVKRSGLRPYIVSTQFEDPTDNNKDYYRSPRWAKIIGDAVIGGHLKMNGTIECIGIVDPIAIGDNLEYNNIVFHIEQISHVSTIDPVSGNKIFRTTIGVSYGIDISSNSSRTIYSQMNNTNMYRERKDDFSKEQILPGISEEQDVVYRPDSNEQTKERTWPNEKDIKRSNSPFGQPTPISRRKK